MAVKKTSNKSAKEAVTIKSVAELKIELIAKQNDLIDAKRGHKQGELINPCVIRSTRKQIARIHTAIRAAETTAAKEGK